MIKDLLMPINIHFKLTLFNRKWRSKNKSNYTVAKSIFPIDDVKVGNYTYGKLNIIAHNSDAKLFIGNFCSIAENVEFILCGEHKYTALSTYPFKAQFLKENEAFSKGDINIGDDVWIGNRCLILSGITIGQGAVVAAGTIVTKDIPPYAIFAGGKVIKYRFSEDIIKLLLKIDYNSFKNKINKKNIEILYKDLNIDILRNELSEIFDFDWSK